MITTERLSHDEFVKQQSKPKSKGNTKAQWIVLGVALAGWAYTGFMGPGTLLSGFTAVEQCIDFVERNQSKIGYGYSKPEKIFAVEKRIRHGKWVVELGFREEGKSSFRSRVCTIGGGYITLESMLDTHHWD